MAQSLVHLLRDALPLLRYVPSLKRVRAGLDGHPVLDSTRAVLAWEPRRVVPSFAVPREDVIAELVDAEPDPPPAHRSVGFGTVLAETDESMMLFEGTFPLSRYYLHRRAVRLPLVPGQRRTTCAYKGHASHWTIEAGGLRLPDIAWSYEQPEHDAERVRGLISFYTERLDVFVDGEPVARVRTPWSAAT